MLGAAGEVSTGQCPVLIKANRVPGLLIASPTFLRTCFASITQFLAQSGKRGNSLSALRVVCRIWAEAYKIKTSLPK